MQNLRKINKFYLSGGWVHVPKDLKHLQTLNIKAILDLQFFPGDSQNKAYINYISEEAEKVGIEYRGMPMVDGDNDNLSDIFGTGAETLEKWELQFPKKRDSILVKCAAGVSRSASMLINYLCARDNKSYVDVLHMIRNAEEQYAMFGVSPSYEFVKYLKSKYPDTRYE